MQVSKGTRSSDIVSMLVNIYGSKELFASEYQTLLAERLLAPGGVDTEREVRYLECLKLRFGEAQLHSCEVMLRDVADSKRLHANLASGAALAPAVSMGTVFERCHRNPVLLFFLGMHIHSWCEQGTESFPVLFSQLKCHYQNYLSLGTGPFRS